MDSNSDADDLTQAVIQVLADKNPQTVQELIALVQQKGMWLDEEVAATVMKLQAESKIRLNSPSLPVVASFSSYVRSNRALWYWGTVAVSIFTMLFSFLISETLYPWSYIRNVLGLIFVLWLPGYTFIKALFPVNVPITETSTSLRFVERIALSIIMSMALVALIGLFLNFTPWGINLTMAVFSLLVFSLVFSTVAVVREYYFAKVKSENIAFL